MESKQKEPTFSDSNFHIHTPTTLTVQTMIEPVTQNHISVSWLHAVRKSFRWVTQHTGDVNNWVNDEKM